MKWVELAKESSNLRFEVLSEQLNEMGHKNSVDFIQVNKGELSEALEEAKAKYDFIRIGPPYGEEVLTLFNHCSAHMRVLQTTDSLLKIEGKWWMRSAMYHGFNQILSEIGNQLNLESSVLIVGAGSGARIICAAFMKIGFKVFNISNKFSEEALALIENLKSTYFDVEFNFIPQEQLILLPGTNGVMVNTTPLIPSNDLLKELYYFNFLHPTGLAIDLTFVPYDTPLIKEGAAIGVEVVRGYEISSWADMVWADWCFGAKLDRRKYCSVLRDRIKAVDFDLTPFED